VYVPLTGARDAGRRGAGVTPLWADYVARVEMGWGGMLDAIDFAYRSTEHDMQSH
jgi:hypothetical protein